MTDRFNRGKEFTNKFMSVKQRYVSASSGMSDVHANILSWQSEVALSGTGQL